MEKNIFSFIVPILSLAEIQKPINQVINGLLEYPEPGSNRHGSESTGV